MKEHRRNVYLTKEKLSGLSAPNGSEISTQELDICAEKMRTALQSPTKVPNLITFIELEP